MLLIQWDGTVQDDVNLFVDYEVLPVKKKARIIDLSTGKEIPAQVLTKRAEGAYWVLEVSDIPAMGYKALRSRFLIRNRLQMQEQMLKCLRISSINW